ncbi:TrmH family RNA methyltransferase [Candidatus Parcubacteria bacterium]|nr:TrmH family RNA methyltransferase [Candidatus Parcubacteria bacterium]
MIYLILHNIRSTHNVGSIFRTADAAGVYKIFLTGYTPQPIDRFGRAQKDIAKVALGAEKNIPWHYIKNVHTVLDRMKKEKIELIALEQSKESIDYKKIKPKKSWALILGNEVGGISPAILKKCDLICEIPMKGKKESLNVSVAAGIALFCFARI